MGDVVTLHEAVVNERRRGAREAARTLGIGLSLLYQETKQGRLEAYRIGNKLMYGDGQLARYLSERRTQVAAA